ncbi:MAG: DUF1801 domain-containing protein [Patescibacteria group bacterium]|jgi:hypothetical protein
MVSSKASTVPEYLKSLPADRRAGLSAVRKVILKNLPKGYVESMNWGMITYEIPLKRYPHTYNGQPLAYAALGSQKNYMAVYLMNVYGSTKTAKWFREQFRKRGKKLNMGKSCVRFKRIEDLPLDVIGKVIGMVSVNQYIAHYEKTRKK